MWQPGKLVIKLILAVCACKSVRLRMNNQSDEEKLKITGSFVFSLLVGKAQAAC